MLFLTTTESPSGSNQAVQVLVVDKTGSLLHVQFNQSAAIDVAPIRLDVVTCRLVDDD
jgi:hypothetical protein